MRVSQQQEHEKAASWVGLLKASKEVNSAVKVEPAMMTRS